MIKTVLVHLRGMKSDAATLSAALQIARPFGAHLECLHIRPDLATLISRAAPATMDDDTDILTRMVEQLQKESAGSAQHASDAFTEFCVHEGIPRGELPTGSTNEISASFREDIGGELERLTAHTRRHDLVVVKGGSTKTGGLGSDTIGRLILGSGRPVLLAPILPSKPMRIVAVAWKDRPEAARAVAAAMPIFEKVKRIFVVTAAEGDEPPSDQDGVVSHLRWHGLSAEAHRVEPRGRDACDAVLETARAADADLLVAGAYGRNRLSEIIFGGFTEGLLEDASLPVLFVH